MSDVPNFENQLFISYAHIDNARFTGVEKGWVDHLHERLEICLAQELGAPPKIWRDRKLGGNDVFNDTITIELSGAAILVSIISPRYVQSASCKRELDDFIRLAPQNGGVRIGDKHRVFKVLKTHVPLEEHPPDLRDMLGYEFYQRDPASGRVREFDHEISFKGDKDQQYWNKLKDLVWDLKELIKRVEKRDPASAAPPSGATIFLAETTSDLASERDKVKRELQQYGHLVLPDKPLPLRATALQEAVREYLSQSRLSVHLIGEHYGLIPEMETERSIIHMQEELAIERGDNAEFSRLIWMPPDLQPKDARQRQFISRLQNSFNSPNGSELLQVKLEDLKTIIQTKLTQKAKPVAAVPDDAAPARIYLICDRQDERAVEPLQNHLFDQSCEAILPMFDGTEAEVIQDHKENLTICDAILIFQDLAGEGWLRAKLSELRKLPAYGRSAPLIAKAIYIGGQEALSKERFRTLEAPIIKHYGEFTPASLDSFLTQVRRAKGA